MWERLLDLWEAIRTPAGLMLIGAIVGLAFQLRRIERQNSLIIDLLNQRLSPLSKKSYKEGVPPSAGATPGANI